ncbi:hypothetical protein Tco_1318273 [Tanacetum coccineum]
MKLKWHYIPKLASEVTSLKKSKNLTTLSLTNSLENLKGLNEESNLRTNSETSKAKENKVDLFALKARKESSDEEKLNLDSKMKRYGAKAVRDIQEITSKDEDDS